MNFRIEYESKTRTKRSSKGKTTILGKIVAITGALPGMTRAQAEWWVTHKKHAAYSHIVDKRVGYLIIGKQKGSKPTSKMVMATKLHIPIIKFEDVA